MVNTDNRHVFDAESETWSKLMPMGGSTAPCPRSFHGMAAGACGEKVYVFGGCGASGRSVQPLSFTFLLGAVAIPSGNLFHALNHLLLSSADLWKGRL
jgi:hypothetical protein